MHQKLSGEHKDLDFFSQKRKCATARLKLETWNSWAPNSWLRQTAIERKEGMTRTLIWTRRQWLPVSSSRDWAAMTPTTRHWSRKHGVWVYGGGGANSLVRSCSSSFMHSSWRWSSATKEWTSEPTNKRFSPANFVYRPQARGGLEAEAARDPCMLTPSMISTYLVYD